MRKSSTLLLGGTLLMCAACVAYDTGPGPGYYGGGPGYYDYGAPNYPWGTGVAVDIRNGYGHGWHGSNWGHPGPAHYVGHGGGVPHGGGHGAVGHGYGGHNGDGHH